MSGLPKCLSNLADVDVNTLTPERRAAFDALVAAGHEAERAEDHVRAMDKRLSVAFDAVNDARKRVPKVTHTDIAREWIASQKAVAEGRL